MQGPSKFPDSQRENKTQPGSLKTAKTTLFPQGSQGYSQPVDGAALTLTDVGVPQISLWVLEVEGLALLTVASHGVVLAVVTHAPAGVPRCHVHSHVKVALAGVPIAVALCDKDKAK